MKPNRSQMTQLEKDKIIFGYHTMIDWDKAKIDRVTALIEVRVTRSEEKALII